jgi:CrcB protein
METFSKYMAVAFGGALGAVARYLITNSFISKFFAPFPFATFFINVSGSFLIGVILTLVVERSIISDYWRLFFAVGFLGAYTTFSTFEFETLSLIRGKEFFYAALYVLSSFIAGFIAVCAGVWLAKKF